MTTDELVSLADFCPAMADTICVAAKEWALARRAALRELQGQKVNVAVSIDRLARAEAGLYALFPDGA